MPHINENVILNSQSPGTCRAHRGTLSSLSGLQNKNQAVLRDEESGLACQTAGAAGLIRQATATTTEGM
jgi:hypothetical protein